VNASGSPQWTANGRALAVPTGAANALGSVHLVADGAGGAIFSYISSPGTPFLYASRIRADGTSVWYATQLTKLGFSTQRNAMCSDGAGGAIVAWEEAVSVGVDIVAQRVSSVGTTLWTSNEQVVCGASGNQAHPAIASDGSGGAIVSWEDPRGISNYQIYTQRVAANGAMLWGLNGEPLRYSVADQLLPKTIADGAGGAIVAFQETGPFGLADIYAQRVISNGSMFWGSGTAVSTAAQNQLYPFLTTDGAQGAIMG
jgi:hypothetical protein